MLRRIGAPQAGGRRRRRGRAAQIDGDPGPVTLTRVTAIRAFAPFSSDEDAARWLDEACEAEDTVEVLVADGLALLNRALHAQAVASGSPSSRNELAAEQAERVLVGYGSGEETADSRFTEAREADLTPRRSSRRRQREKELRPQERVAGVLRGRERLDACETLLLRARADLDAGRRREAALQLRVGLEALLVELKGALSDPGHEEDMAMLQERRMQAGDAANAALRGDLDPAQQANVQALLEVGERVLRRRRVLQG